MSIDTKAIASNLPANIRDSADVYLLAGINRATGQVETVFFKHHNSPTHRGENWAFVTVFHFTSYEHTTAAESMISAFHGAIPWLDWTIQFMDDSTKKYLRLEK